MTAASFRALRNLLGAWLLASTIAALAVLVATFPERVGDDSALWAFPCWPGRTERGYLLLAALGGALGSSLHAVQSFGVFVGNRSLRLSWAWWYLLRAPIGSVLAVLFYAVMRGGLIPGPADGVSPYGVVALGGLAGLFAKKAVDKLEEVFDAMFRTRDGAKYTDPLASAALALTSISPAELEIAAGVTRLELTGSGFSPACTVTIGGAPVDAEFASAEQLVATLDPGAFQAGEVEVVVVDPGPPERRSQPVALVLS